jgi:O-antigen/teichoic acid export membrane protein
MIERTFRISSTLRRLIINTGWLFVMRILRMLFALFVGIWIARYLGPERYGALSYALAFVMLFGPISHLGLDGVVVREIVNDPDRKREILGTTFFLRLAASITCFAAALVITVLIRPGDALARMLVGIIAFGFIFSSFDTIDIWFQSQIEVKYSVYAKSFGLACSNIGKILLILSGAALVSFAWLTALEIIISAIGLVFVYRYRGFLIHEWRFRLERARSLLAISWPMILSGALFMIYLRIDQVMLREMVDERAVGIYSVAVRISEVWYFIPAIVTTSIFPELVKSRRLGGEVYRARLQSLYDFLAWTAAPIVAFLTLFSRPLVSFLYGEAFADGGVILTILAWPCPFIFMREVYGRWLLNENLTKYFLLAHGSGALVNVVLNLFLIPSFGGIGAAVATVVSYTIGGYLICFVHPRTRPAGVMMTRALAMPFLRLRGRSGGGGWRGP